MLSQDMSEYLFSSGREQHAFIALISWYVFDETESTAKISVATDFLLPVPIIPPLNTDECFVNGMVLFWK